MCRKRRSLMLEEKRGSVGYDKGSPTYLIYFPEKGIIRKSRCVRFTDKLEKNEDVQGTTSVSTDDEMTISVPPPTYLQPTNGNDHELLNDSGPNAIHSQNESVQTPASRYPRREHEKPKYLGFVGDNNVDENDNISFTVDYCYNIPDAPRTYLEAISSPDSYKWQNAMEEEIQALRENDTF